MTGAFSSDFAFSVAAHGDPAQAPQDNRMTMTIRSSRTYHLYDATISVAPMTVCTICCMSD